MYVLMAAINQDGEGLYIASENLNRDREIMMAAVIHNGMALELVSEGLKRYR